MDDRHRHALLGRRWLLIRCSALFMAMAATIACRHSGETAIDDAEEYDVMRITPPTPAAGRMGGGGGS